MTKADLVLGQAIKLSNEASVIKSWYRGWWCCGRFSYGRKAQKTIEVIQKINEEGIAFGTTISSRKPTQSLNLVGTNDFNAFASRDSTTAEILKALLDDATNLLGIHGMPGVGKTTLIKEIAKQVKEKQLFQEVVVVIVSQYPDPIKLQKDIAEGLDLELNDDNVGLRAQRLSERLNQGTQTTLVILDDLWKRIELSEVGIPYKNNGNCCKVVFTTRERAVCDMMEVNARIEVSLLSEEDSWILFQQKSGTVANLSVARELLNECKCLPLAIITLGLALRNKDKRICNGALQQLQKSIFKGMTPVVSSIKLSYNFLENESKVCFLFCCLFPEDHRIELDRLLTYMMGEKLVKDVDTYEEARLSLYGILDELLSSGLLSKDSNENIGMHDVVRDVAILIATEEEGHVVKAGRYLSYWPDMELDNCKRLSLMYNFIQHLPITPVKAPHLRALFLNDNHRLKELPPNVFVEMTSLMTLDLSNTYIKFLPPSLSFLENLRTLLLNQTPLSNLSPVHKLEKLEVLSLISCNSIEVFPEEMGNLSNLKVLDLSGTNFKKNINPNLISKLHRLEIFHLLGYEPKPNIEKIDFLCEFRSLSRLTSLQLRFDNPEVCHIETPESWENLKTFQIFVNSRFQPNGFSRSLFLEGIQRRKEVANWVLMLLGRTYFLKLEKCPDLLSFTEFGGAKGMNHNLKSLCLDSCPKMECLVNNKGLLESKENAFSNLEELHVEGMSAFVEICKGTDPPPKGLLCKLKRLSFVTCSVLLTAIPLKLRHNLLHLESLEIQRCTNLLYVLETEEEAQSSSQEASSNIVRILEPLVLPIFPNLKSFEITKIPKIKYVFTMRVARNLLLLEDLQIEGYSEMEVILKYEDGEDIKCDQDTAILPRLKKLHVFSARKLKSFTNRNLLLELQSLEYLRMSGCDILERLPFGATGVPNLQAFTLSGIPKIKYVFTMRLARNLLLLDDLDINHCPEMEVIFKYEDGEDIKCNQDTAILPHLKKLNLQVAPNLKSFTNQNLVMDLPSLEDLTLTHCDILERLPFGTTSVPNLQAFRLEWCPKIRYVFSMRVARNLLKLEKLVIEGCSGMEVLFKYEDGEDIKCDQDTKDTAILLRLKKLSIWGAPKLKSFTNQNLVMELPSLQELRLYECDILERLPFGTTSVPNLKHINMKWCPKIRPTTIVAASNTSAAEERISTAC